MTDDDAVRTRRTTPTVGLVAVAVALFATACGQGNAFDMEIGECFQEPDALEFSDVDKVDCAEPHDNEVFAIYNLTTPSLPTADVMFEGCVQRFGAAIGTSYETSIYYVSLFGPTQESWDDLNDREVVCYVYLPDEKKRGSALGTGA